FHQGPVVSGIYQVREVLQDLSYLIAALTAAHIDYNVCIGPLRQLVLGERLSGPEASGYGCGAPLGDRKQAVYYTLSCNQRLIHGQPSFIRPGCTDWPFLYHGQVMDHLPVPDPDNGLRNGITAVF